MAILSAIFTYVIVYAVIEDSMAFNAQGMNEPLHIRPMQNLAANFFQSATYTPQFFGYSFGIEKIKNGLR